LHRKGRSEPYLCGFKYRNSTRTRYSIVYAPCRRAAMLLTPQDTEIVFISMIDGRSEDMVHSLSEFIIDRIKAGKLIAELKEPTP